MKRRPGLWLALTALVAGASMLGLAGCGSSSSSSSGERWIRRKRGDPCSPGRRRPIKIALAGNIDYLDPALAYYQSTWQIEYSTCVKLTNYKDEAGDQGRVIYPEAASSLPEISSDGLTYTYTVPPGKFKFNTGEPVTAESFQYALERDLNPKQASYFGSVFLAPFIKGASDFKGKPGEHVSGIQVDGDKLIIQPDQEGRRPDLEADDAVRVRRHQGHAGRPEGRPHARRRWPVLHRGLHAEPLDRAEEEPELHGRPAGLRRRDRLHAADHRSEPGHPGGEERPARLHQRRASSPRRTSS